MQRITPFLWFNNEAQEAAQFYTSIFNNSKLGGVSRNTESSPGPTGSVMVASFQLDGQNFIALNGGPQYKFTEAVSFVVHCDTQEEVDYYWEKLSEGGSKGRCGWLKDKFGLSWQVVPATLGQLMQDKDTAKVKRMTEAMMQMDKLDIAALREAHAQG